MIWLFHLFQQNIFSIWPAVLRQATYGTIKFGTYYTLKKVVTEKGWLIDKHGNERVWCNVLCAVTGKQFAFEIDCKEKRNKISLNMLKLITINVFVFQIHVLDFMIS